MKLAIIGAAGVRTPLIAEAIVRRQDRLPLDELALMDVDGDRLDLIATLSEARGLPPARFKVERSTDARRALSSADFVITTFRVGGIEARVVDERVPLNLGVLGQETTGPGGFAMGMRAIPVLLGYLRLMAEACPQAWLINFANPAGMLAEAAFRLGGWKRTVGICDGPQVLQRGAAALLGVPPEEVFLDYFGLNHLGWARAVLHRGEDYLPQFLQMARAAGAVPGLPFDAGFLEALGMIPNEYLYYYYHAAEAVANILASEQTRGEVLAALNQELLAGLRRLRLAGDAQGMAALYQRYLKQRGHTYMATETGRRPGRPGLEPAMAAAAEGDGYAGVALDLIEALSGSVTRAMILNVPNAGAIPAMAEDDVVEVPALVSRDLVRPLAVGPVPDEVLGLMKVVKAYERLTIAAATEGSYDKALQALAIHPLVADVGRAKAILEAYREQHGPLFPRLR